MNIIIIIILFSLIYCLLLIDDTTKLSKPENPKEEKINHSIVYLITNNNYFISINKSSKTLYLTKDNSLKEKFEISPISKKIISLMSTSLKSLIGIKYTAFYNTEYDVIVSSTNLLNNNKLKLYKKQKYYYIKFYNGYYLSSDINGNIFASKDKNKILLFKIKKIQ